jgi:hypothetical protein
VSEEAARTEAEQQQATDDPAEAEWIYLRNRSGQWVARRTPRNMRQPKTTWRQALLEALNPFDGVG